MKNVDELEVWLDADIVSEPICVGFMHHSRGVVRFEYSPGWLLHPARFALDPDLSLDSGNFYPDASLSNFRIFDDSAPDRWGQTLIQRREAIASRDEGRRPRNLYAWDYFLGVQDFTRQGAIRVCPKDKHADSFKAKNFLDDHPLSAPPLTKLRELEAISCALSSKDFKDTDQLKKWLSVLVAPGASLGGARPKANFTDEVGQLWIAKFPAKDDVVDVGAWEALAYQLALDVGINVGPMRLMKLSPKHKTFCVQRFDRFYDGKKIRRRFYASAMAMLRKDSSEESSYLDLAEFIRQQGASRHVQIDLEQLFRRVLFNIAIGNRDDHLRNHGFLLSSIGWRLAPAFDMNPNLDKAEHVLNIDLYDNQPSISNALATAAWYDLSNQAAQRIADEVIAGVSRWQEKAAVKGCRAAEIAMYRGAFIT